MKVEIELPEMLGYEYTGEFRPPKKGEYYLTASGIACCACHDFLTSCYHILRKVIKYRQPTIADLRECEPFVECEFRTRRDKEYQPGAIIGAIFSDSQIALQIAFHIKHGTSYVYTVPVSDIRIPE